MDDFVVVVDIYGDYHWAIKCLFDSSDQYLNEWRLFQNIRGEQ